METDSAENKRKRQDSINKEAALEPSAAPVPEVDTPEASEAPVPEQVSSPCKKPRTSTTGDSDEGSSNEESSAEDAKTATKSVQAIEIEKKPMAVTEVAVAASEVSEASSALPASNTSAAPAAKPTFGMGFGSSSSSGFASAAKKASPFAAFTSSTSGFAKYAVKKPEEPVSPKAPVSSKATTSSSTAPDDKPQTDLASPKQSTQSFEAMLSEQGDQTLETKATAHTDKPVNPDVPVRTFEEDETCLFSTKARLFELAGGNWKERGNGQFKVNRHTVNGRRRMVMRTDLTFRLILNAPLFSGMKAACERRFVRFTCFDAESSVPTNFALRFPTDAAALAAYQGIVENIPAEETERDDEGKDESEDEEEEEEEKEEGDSENDASSNDGDSDDNSDGEEEQEQEQKQEQGADADESEEADNDAEESDQDE
ncbi:hypothetical protein LPJ64_003512 [Coemansia asiatica]|uniref:RanBD1 domain-containing protein n=1 Tax=Coemansia asiatica TaxID=1052880 RepID=A0A9W7XJM2_9FUNG|nr:hypothetical protein LPJ64_003512 [Coemansia asiatica]